ncbi:hypothetical protein DW079_14905 [Segatella copri]|uniref:Uncharacterized protein n=3 Tax=Segatella copri TaxID=165179 RepID=A0A3R6IJR7_9BACT|nr:hypothetical protein DW079_14905 [Segatella copri]
MIQKARKITCPVGEKYLPNWENKKVMKTRLQASKRVVSLAKLNRGQKKIMNQSMKAFIRYLIVAICSAIVTFLSSSCTAGLVIGKNQRQHQENNISTKVDSTYYVPTITIR